MKFKTIDKSKTYAAMIILSWLTILTCWILKLFGTKDFEIPFIKCDLLPIHMILLNGISYLINSISYLILLYKRKLKLKEIIFCIVVYSILFILSLKKELLSITMILELTSYIIFALIGIKDKVYKKIIEAITISIVFIIYEIITSSFKEINIFNFKYNFIEGMILQIDYYALIYLTIMHYIKKGGYLYVSILSILNRFRRLVWKTILVLFSRNKCNQKSLHESKEIIQEVGDVENEVGYKLFIVVLSIFQITFVGAICYFINQVIIEYFIIIISFFILRQIFGNSYHVTTIIKCTALASIVFLTATRLSLPLYLSVLCNVFIGALVAYSMYIMYYFIKYTSNEGITIQRGMNKDLLLELCQINNLSEDEILVMTLFYCDRLKLWQIAQKFNYSEANISKIKEKALKKLK